MYGWKSPGAYLPKPEGNTETSCYMLKEKKTANEKKTNSEGYLFRITAEEDAMMQDNIHKNGK